MKQTGKVLLWRFKRAIKSRQAVWKHKGILTLPVITRLQISQYWLDCLSMLFGFQTLGQCFSETVFSPKDRGH